MTISGRLAEEFTEASRELGLEIVVPFELTLPSGVHISAAVLVRNFGARNGMLILNEFGAIEGHVREIDDAGFGFSVVTPEPLGAPIDLEAFVDMLSDWGWSGPPERQPTWLRPRTAQGDENSE